MSAEPNTEPQLSSAQLAYDAKRAFVLVRGKQLAAHAGERTTRRQTVEAIRRQYTKICDAYLRTSGTTYADWLAYGPKAEWDEILAAADDDAVWDRLVDRCVERERVRG
jgi:hypothetical protein